MLALKKIQLSTRPKEIHLLDLPDELLHEIVQALFFDCDRTARAIATLSMTCQRFRKAAAPLLFRKLHVRLTSRCVDRRTFNILIGLFLAPHTFACYVRHLVQHDDFRHREEGFEDLTLKNDLVKGLTIQAFQRMTNLRTISVGCSNSPILDLLTQIYPTRSFEFRIEICACSSVAGTTPRIQKLYRSAVGHRFSVSTTSGHNSHALDWSTNGYDERMLSLCWRNMPVHRAEHEIKQSIMLSNFKYLQELHLQSNELDQAPFALLAEGLVQLKSLRRLSLNGPGLCSAILMIVGQLTGLQALRLNSTLDRIFHAHLHNQDFVGLPYLNLPHLESLEIRYISRYLAIESIVPKGLKHLKIEYHNRNERLTAYDVRYIAKIAPRMECLEINCGPLSHLWHPTAIAGVDVEMDVYGLLDALSHFRSLRRLRLFPSYWRSRAGYLHFVQPVEDEQAVRIYNHLRLKCQSLQALIISCSYLSLVADNGALSRGRTVPAKWHLRSSGPRTLLKTHEAGKDYHLDQQWEGDRRLIISNSRHRNRVPHFDELQDWTLPSYEFEFDEPQPCQDQVMAGSSL